jgi:hypothetical protein
MQVASVRDVRGFLEQHQLTEKQYKEFKMWSGKLSSLLFS